LKLFKRFAAFKSSAQTESSYYAARFRSESGISERVKRLEQFELFEGFSHVKGLRSPFSSLIPVLVPKTRKITADRVLQAKNGGGSG